MEPTESGNWSQQTPEFVFLGFSGAPHGHTPLFLVFLAIYLATVIGNATIFALIQLDARLHSPMYFFLSHLSCLDVCYSSVTVPKILANLLRQQHTISYAQCMAQAFFRMACAGSECALLAAMAYDRYLAICRPLHYGSLMGRRVRVPLAAASWLWGLLDSALHTAPATNLAFCGAPRIDPVFCDVPPLLKTACSDTRVNEI
ncbi:hypothetical protein EYD10_00823 [Varanus komodoensis]|nr:hypothetical protein EYD10_00823 [Varanus komodoensis]